MRKSPGGGASTSQRREVREAAVSLLPARDADAGSYARHLEPMLTDPEAPTELLLAILAELWRRQDDVAAGSAHTELESAADNVARALVGRRQERQREHLSAQDRGAQLRERTQGEPLRRRLLYALASKPSTPTALAADVSATKEAVSRALTKLEQEGLLETQPDPDDGRRRVYALTRAGGSARREQTTLPVANLADYRIAAARPFLEGALQEAIARRRHANDLDDAVTRFRRIKAEARKAGASDVELRARRELTTTLRQASLDRAFYAELREMQQIASGAAPGIDPQLTVPAHGHVAYELGRRRGDHSEEYLAKRVVHLLASSEIFGTLARADAPGDDWSSRQAWALYGLGDARQLRTQFGPALSDAARALRLFTEIEDVYGIASCLLLAGVCLRLRGQLAESLAVLDAARNRAADNDFFRLHADSLMQLGEANRSIGQLQAAEGFLRDAIARADALRSVVTGSFARSSLASALYEHGRYDEATAMFSAAHSLFAECRHPAGLALNLHRQGVLQRSLATDGRSPGDHARGLLQKARRSYDRLESPAGVVACYIEEGRLALDAGRRLTPIWRQRLVDWITPISSRELLEKDPWLPATLPQFAQTVGDDRLIALGQAVSNGWAGHQREHQHEWAQINTVFDVSVSTVRARTEPDAMAGERRRQIVSPASAL